MTKRTIATIRNLIETANTVLPAGLDTVSFRKRGVDRYVITFNSGKTEKHFGPMACGEACEFLTGIIHEREETKALMASFEKGKAEVQTELDKLKTTLTNMQKPDSYHGFPNGYTAWKEEKAKAKAKAEELREELGAARKTIREDKSRIAELEMAVIKWNPGALTKKVPAPPVAKEPNIDGITYSELVNHGWSDLLMLTWENGKYASLVPMTWQNIRDLIKKMSRGK